MRRGLTLLEILVALVVLIIGILPIFALFPLGQQRAVEVMRNTYVSIIVHSVRDALKLGMSRMRLNLGTEEGFVYMGPGVAEELKEEGRNFPSDMTYEDGDPPKIETAAAYWIRLPQGKQVFMFPRRDPKDPTSCDFAGFVTDASGTPDTTHPKTERVFHLGWWQWRVRNMHPGDRDPDDPPRTLTKKEIEDAKRDPLSAYSYAIRIMEAYKDTNGDGKPDTPVTSDRTAFTVTIYVYFGFRGVENLISKGRKDMAFRLRRHHPVAPPYHFILTQ